MREPSIVFCPICRSRREQPVFKVPSIGIAFTSFFWAVFSAAGVGLLFTITTGLWVGFLFGLLSFLVLEVYYTHKFRRELVCPVCDFDPILFRKSPDKARERCLRSAEQRPLDVRKHWAAFEQRQSGIQAVLET